MITIGLLLTAVLATAVAAPPLPPADALHALFEREWQRRLGEDPITASYVGDRRFNALWPDMSIDAIAQHARDDDAAARVLAAIDTAALSPEDQLNASLLVDMLGARQGTFKHRLWLLALDQMGGVHQQQMLIEALPFATVQDYDDWLARLRAYPALIDQHIALLRRGIAERFVQARVAVARVPAQIRAEIVDDPTKSSFFAPFARLPADLPAPERARLVAAARTLINDAVVPALRQWLTVVEQEYLPGCSMRVGMGDKPGGKAAYAFLVRMHTTTTKTPDQIHALGLGEVARIRAAMERQKDLLGFHGTLAELFTALRTEPKYFLQSGDEILLRTRALAKTIDGRLTRVMKTMPRTPYGVEPIPDAIAPDQTTAYYSPPSGDGARGGTYFVNTYKPEARPTWEMVPLALHESVPGHHMQIALTQEHAEVPSFRRYLLPYTAYVEGWGLYAESLGDDMGLYDNPADKMGQLAYQMWRAVRLVVDTGMHSRGWTREKAIAYFLANAPKTQLDVENEIDRYIVWPGQALAYKSGELALQAIRRRAQQQLGARFNLGELHDVVLLDGPLPLDLLDRRVDAWLKSKRAP